MVKDPVCGMEIKDISKSDKKEYKGKIYYFCTTLCMIQFEHEPEKYINKNVESEREHKH